MACPSYGIINENLSFNIVAQAPSGAPIYATGSVVYTVYEENTDNPVSGFTNLTMTKDSDDTGVYYASIAISADNFTKYKTYIILIKATVSGVALTKSYTFIVTGRAEIDAVAGVLTGDLRAVASFRGKFKQGGIADLLIKITDFDGDPIDPSSISVAIVGPTEDPSTANDVVAETSSPFQINNGYYVFSWDIDSDQTIGNYNVTWTYIISGTTSYEYQTVTVVESQNNTLPSSFYTERLIAIREALEYHLACAQTIPIYFEQAKPSRDNTSFEFSFSDWNQSAGVKIYRNEVLINADVEVDYFKGKVTFDSQLLPQEVVYADYNFKWFSEEELTRFLVNSLQTVNTFPPHTGFTLDDIPDRYFPALLYGATKDALRQLMMCLQFQQPAQVFGGIENAQKAFANFETLKQNYEKDWEKLLEQKKFGPYPKSLLVVTPEYTLPGGRSRWFRYLFK